MTRIVCDTGPLLHLREADLLPLLEVAGEIRVPPAVRREAASRHAEWTLPEWVTVVPLGAAALESAVQWQRAGLLDPGEAEALALAVQENAGWFLTDDAAARWLAQSLGQEVHGSLGLVLWAAASGHLDSSRAHDALTRLERTSLWISARVLDEARMALRQILS